MPRGASKVAPFQIVKKIKDVQKNKNSMYVRYQDSTDNIDMYTEYQRTYIKWKDLY